MRRTVEGWYQAADELVGTERYGTEGPGTGQNEFSLPFVDREYDQVIASASEREGAYLDVAV